MALKSSKRSHQERLIRAVLALPELSAFRFDARIQASMDRVLAANISDEHLIESASDLLRITAAAYLFARFFDKRAEPIRQPRIVKLANALSAELAQLMPAPPSSVLASPMMRSASVAVETIGRSTKRHGRPIDEVRRILNFNVAVTLWSVGVRISQYEEGVYRQVLERVYAGVGFHGPSEWKQSLRLGVEAVRRGAWTVDDCANWVGRQQENHTWVRKRAALRDLSTHETR